jgi:hypothetical protein
MRSVNSAGATVQRVELFEAELARRGLRYSAVPFSSQCVVWVRGTRLVVSLDNLARQFTGAEDDAQRVSWFTDQVIAAAEPASLTADGLYWFLEPGGYEDGADCRERVSPRLDRVLVHADAAGALIRWVPLHALTEIGLSVDAASRHAWSNLDTALARAEQVTYPAPGGATLLSFATAVPSKASLLLAPSLRAAVEGTVGWPVMAVAPDRGFVYVWNAGHRDLIGRLGAVVTREHARAPWPLSAEVFEIGDSIRAIGSYQDRG